MNELYAIGRLYVTAGAESFLGSDCTDRQKDRWEITSSEVYQARPDSNCSAANTRWYDLYGDV